jgi:regulator of nucleoside diphosphate kinase
VNDEDLDRGIATLGSQVEYLDNLTGLRTVVTLTYPTSESSFPAGLSVLTPEGACILGLSEGQSMQYWTAKGLVCDVTLRAVLKGTASVS